MKKLWVKSSVGKKEKPRKGWGSWRVEAVERQRFVQEMRLEVLGGLANHGKRKSGHPAAVLPLGMPSAQDAPQNDTSHSRICICCSLV